jgi:hypothetical protein
MDDQRTNRESGGSVSEPTSRKRIHFRLVTLLFFITLIGVALGSYVIGEKVGFHRGASAVSSEYQRAYAFIQQNQMQK